MKPLRLTIYLPDFRGGGVERVTLMLIDAFVARGLEVSVVVHRASGELRELMPAQVRLVSLGAKRSLVALPRLVAYLKRDAPEVLLSNLGHNNIVALWARALARLGARCDTRVVICQHNALSIEARSAGNWQHRLLPRLYRWFGHQAEAIVGVSHGVSQDMARSTGIPLARITTIHNPVIDARFAGALDQQASHPWLRDPALRVVVGIGRLVPQKDFATLIRAFARLGRADTRLIILGEGPERVALTQLASALGVALRVDLAGFAINPLPTLRDADVMVLSSLYEGFGNVLVEALGAGVPVVATRCPYGPEEILADGRFGELVPVGNAQAMADAIARQLDAPMPARALRHARAQDFHVDRVAQAYLALFDPDRHGEAPPAWKPGSERPISQRLRERGVFVYLPNLRLGGGELSLVRLAAGFAECGLPVTLVVHDERQREIPVPPGVELVSMGTGRSLLAVSGLVRLLRLHRPALMLTAFPHNNVVAVLARQLARVDCRLVVSEHAPLTQQYLRMRGWRYRFLPPFVRWAYPRADAIVAVSEGVRVDLDALDPRLMPQVIYNPVLPADWAARAALPCGHPWLDEPGLEVVLSVARLSAEKNLPSLLAAFSAVSAIRSTARLLIAGEGPERASLENCIARLGLSEKVQLVGMVQNPLAWMRRARVLVLASLYEGFGNVLIEALAAGTQVISTDCPVGPREVLQDGRLGQLVPVGDAGALANAIAAVLDGERAAVGATEREAIAARFTQARACAAYLALFKAIEAIPSRPEWLRG